MRAISILSFIAVNSLVAFGCASQPDTGNANAAADDPAGTPGWVAKGQLFRGDAASPELCAVGTMPKALAAKAEFRARTALGRFLRVTIVQATGGDETVTKTTTAATLSGVSIAETWADAKTAYALGCVALPGLKGTLIFGGLTQEENDALLTEAITFAGKQLAAPTAE